MVGRTARLLRISAATRACEHPISLGVQAACAATSVLTTVARYVPRLYLASGLATTAAAATASGLTTTAAATTAAASGLATLDPLTRVLDPVWPYLEWIDALAIAGYFGVSVLSHGATARATGLRICCGKRGE
mmetsp:Transcript_15963/g.39516  ORF Transcript_15963/g.39516 Transcript_15963/m.39516 type:complete len:133 (-) Transcript_15963:99-497(-)